VPISKFEQDKTLDYGKYVKNVDIVRKRLVEVVKYRNATGITNFLFYAVVHIFTYPNALLKGDLSSM